MKLLVVLAAGAAASVASGQPTFRTIPADDGFDYAVAQDVSADGTRILISLQNSVQRPTTPQSYVLKLSDDSRTYIADPSGRTLNGIAISGDGAVVVGSLGGGPLIDASAFVWNEGIVTDIGGLPAGNVTYATGVSADGSVVCGTSGANFGDPYQQGWRWTVDDGFTPLDDIGMDILIYSQTGRISDDASTVVGFGTIGDFDPDTDDFQHGAVWPAGGTSPIDIGILPNPFGLGPQATACSANGEVVVGFGPATNALGNFANHGFRWTLLDGMVDLGDYPGRPTASVYISDCSSDGNTLVGYLIDGGVTSWEAVIWTQSEGFRILRDVLAAEGVIIPSNIRLRETFCSNDGRVISGWAYNTSNNKYVAYIITLPGPTCAADLTGSSDPNDAAYGTPDGQVDAADFFYYLDQFVAMNLAVADLTASSDPNHFGYGVPNGVIDADDFFYYLDLFVGCP